MNWNDYRRKWMPREKRDRRIIDAGTWVLALIALVSFTALLFVWAR